MAPWIVVSSIVLLAGATESAGVSQRPTSPFDVLRPTVTMTAPDLVRLDAGETLVRSLPERDGRVAVFGARRIAADGHRLAAWVREVAQLKQGKCVEVIGRFSDPPALTDV